MEWLAESAQTGYVLLAFAAFMLAGVWWIQKQIVYLAGAGALLIALLVFWLIMRNVPTAAMTMEADLKSLAKALLDKDNDKALRFVADDLKYKGKNRDKWYAALEEMIEENAVDAIEIEEFKVKSRAADQASVDFRLEARHKGKILYSAECPWKLTRDGDAWQVAKVSLTKASSAKGGKKTDDDD